jgi:hypothetical protein
MDDHWPRVTQILEADLLAAIIAKAEGGRHGTGPESSVRKSRRLQGDGDDLVGVQLCRGRRTWLDLGHIRLQRFATRLQEDI